MTDQTAAARTEISARLMAVAEHTIVAEWICCEPLDPAHDLCAKGYAMLEMTRALLVDDPEASVTAAPLLDAVMGLLPAAVPVPPPADQTAPPHVYRVSEICGGEVRRVHGYHASLESAFGYCETEERKKPLIDSVRFQLFPVPGGEQWLIHMPYGPQDRMPETSDFVISRHEVHDLADVALAVLPEQTDRAELDSLGREADRLRKDWVEMLARAERVEAEVERLRAVQAAALSLTVVERQFLTFALDLASDEMASRGNEFSNEDEAALETLRRVAAEEQHAETQPRRGDTFEAWLKAQRDRHERHGESSEFWHEFDRALDEYRLHADTGTPLGDHVCEARVVGDCGCLEQPPVGEQPAEAHAPSHTWTVESPRRDNWASWGTNYDDRDWALERYESAASTAPQRHFRLVRATTTYVVEAEHTPRSGPETREAP